MNTKKCSSCSVEKELSLFYKDKSNKDGYYSMCKGCKNLKTKELRNKRKTQEKVEILNKICYRCKKQLHVNNFTECKTNKDGYNSICKNCRRERDKIRKTQEIKIEESFTKQCLSCNQIKSNTEFKINLKSNDKHNNICINCQPKNNWTKEKQKESDKKYYIKNIDKIREKWKKDAQKINRKIRDSLNKRISQSLASFKLNKNNTTSEYIGCTIPFLKKWFEHLFTDKMTWENYGDWHIDHVKPCCSFNLENIDDQLLCFNWKNLQPLWKNENLSKGGKINEEYIKNHYIKAINFENSQAQVKEG